MPNRRPPFLRNGYRLLEDLLALVRPGLTSRGHLAAGNLFLRKQLALYQGATDQAAAARPRDARGARRVMPVAGAALDAHGGQTRLDDSVAPPGLATRLAMEIPRRPATDSGRPTAVDRHHGPREPDLGEGAVPATSATFQPTV